jgi:Kdo2-lipid IVA lauroyltransferase/acyltransferase
MGSKIATYTGIACLKFVSVWPFWILYRFSDVMFPVIYYLVGYRRKVVRTNLINAFPEKTLEEVIVTEKKYYRYLCDLLVETIKTKGLSKEDLSKRMVFKNPEIVNSCFEKGRSVIVTAIHHGNWEWFLHMPLFLGHHPLFIYKPMQNVLFDQYWNRGRERFGGETVSMSIALRKMLTADRQQRPVLTWLAADQAPPWNHPFWIDFMNQKTMFFNGPAKLAQRFDQPIYFQQVKRIKRGYYETVFELLVENPREWTEKDIITSYVRKTESVIRNEPALYLWSHRRWKYREPDGAPVY